jgi:signal transduction histidine kinase/putative methionine-R-sulfoxide reductase with GAF domain
MALGIKKQLSILTISILIVAVTITAVLTILIIIRQGEATSREYREAELNRVRTSVKDYVEMAHQSIASNYALIEDNAYLEKFYGHRLRSIMDIAIATINDKIRAVDEGKLSITQAQQQARDAIEAMRFDNKTGYIWINNTTLPYPKMIMHPTVPALNGTYLTDAKFNCAMGKNQNLFQAATEVSLANENGGFVNYVWPKPTAQGLTENVKKLSFVYHVRSWGWVLGTGIYLDDARNDIISSILENLKTLKYNDGQGYFWINDMKQPYPTMIMHPVIDALNGKVLDDTTFNATKGTHENFYQVIVKKAKAEGGGYVEYMWPDPATGKRQDKLSYVKKFEPLNWVIGTGSFIHHIEEKIAAKEKEIHERVRNIILITIGISIILIAGGYWATARMANSLTKSIITVKNSLQDLSFGKAIDKIEVKHNNEIGVMTGSLNNLVDGFNAYSTFAKEIGKGNLNADFKALGSEDELGNSLIQMRNNLTAIDVKEKEQRWQSEGITKINDLIRSHSDNVKELCRKLTSEMARHLKANQVAIYLLEKDENQSYIELTACFAYDRHKHHEQRINVGDGLVGQAILERDYIYLTEVPNGYTKITSGLGSATPTALIVNPLIYNEQVEGVIEIASFKKFATFEIEFLNKAAETIASSISRTKTAERTRVLLEETRSLSEEMKAQEEELRQNNEELQATQEEMARKLLEAEKKNEREG